MRDGRPIVSVPIVSVPMLSRTASVDDLLSGGRGVTRRRSARSTSTSAANAANTASAATSPTSNAASNGHASGWQY